MASKKEYWSRRCDKPRRNNAKPAYWAHWPNKRREIVEPGCKRLAAPTGRKPTMQRLRCCMVSLSRYGVLKLQFA